jgi:hypothetical protein
MLNSTLLQISTKLLIKYHCTRWMEWRAVRDHAPLCLNVSLTFPKATKRQDRQQEETFLFHSRKMTSGYSGASASSNATNAYHHFQFSLFFLLISSCANHWLTDDKNNSWRYGFMYGIFEYWKTKKHERDPSDLLSTNMWQIIVVTLGCWWLTAERSTGPFTYHTHTHTLMLSGHHTNQNKKENIKRRLLLKFPADLLSPSPPDQSTVSMHN